METIKTEFIFYQTLLSKSTLNQKTNAGYKTLVNCEKVSSWPFLKFLKLF